MLSIAAAYFVGLQKNNLASVVKSTPSPTRSKLQPSPVLVSTFMEPCLITYITINEKHSVQQLLLGFSNQATQKGKKL
jgi:hypothetical protein